MRTALVRVLTAACAVLVALGVTACSESTSGEPAQSGLAQAMDSVSGSAPARAWFSYGDLARLRELGAYSRSSGKVHLEQRWNRVVGVGADPLVSVAPILPEVTGIDLFAYDTATNIGEPPNSATKVTGTVHAATITKKLRALGAKHRSFGDTDGLSLGPDNKVDMTSPQVTRLHLINQMNQVVVTDSLVATSPNAATIRAVLGGGTSLLDTDGYRSIADCLGDVLAADVFTPKDAPQAAIIGVGVRDTSSLTGTQHEVVCVLPADGKQHAIRSAMRSGLALTATDPAADSPLSTWFSASKVTEQGTVVRAVLTLRSSTPPGYVFEAVQRRTYTHWVGA